MPLHDATAAGRDDRLRGDAPTDNYGPGALADWLKPGGGCLGGKGRVRARAVAPQPRPTPVLQLSRHASLTP